LSIASDLDIVLVRATPGLPCMRAVQITPFGGPEVLDIRLGTRVRSRVRRE
jgi:hypothetical protein